MKIFKIILINLLLIILILICIESYNIYKWQNLLRDGHKVSMEVYFDSLFHSIPVDKYFDSLYKKEFVEMAFCKAFRPDVNLDSDKKPVVFAGCSFTFGSRLSDDETVSAQFGKLTGRPTYNRGGNGWGLAQFLYQTKRNDFYQQFKEEPEYIFYIYIQDHINRLDRFKIDPVYYEFQPKYIIKNGKFILQKPHFYDRFYTVHDYKFDCNSKTNAVNEDIIVLYFDEAQKEIKKHWENTKLVILIYPTGHIEQEKVLYTKLKEVGHNVINLQDITDGDLLTKEYQIGIDDDTHPNAKAWSVILPALIRELNIKD